jgi:hypothetical protein
VYGQDADARVTGPGGVVDTWSLGEVRDASDNAMHFAYANVASATNTEEHYLSETNYTSNELAAKVAERRVEFSYETRPDVLTRYASGARFRVAKRVSAITAYGSGGVLFRQYQLSYDTGPSTGRSRLIAVTECAGSPLACKPPTRFLYGESARGFSASTPVSPLSGFFDPNWQPNVAPSEIVALRTADLDGDGLEDLVYLVGYPDRHRAIFVKYNDGVGATGKATGVVRDSARHAATASSVNHTVKLPRGLNEASYSAQFVTRYRGLGM